MSHEEKVFYETGKELHRIASEVLTVGDPKDIAYGRREFSMRGGHRFTVFVVKGKELADQMDQTAAAVFCAKDVKPQ